MRLLKCAARLSLPAVFLRNHHSFLLISKLTRTPTALSSASRAMLITTDQQGTSSSSNSAESITIKHYNSFLIADNHQSGQPRESSSLVMINSATMDIELVRRLWKQCDYKICGDGGANRLFDGLSSSEVAEYVPGATICCMECFLMQTF